MTRNAQTAAILAAGEIRAKQDRHPVGKQTGVFRQYVRIEMCILVDGPMDGFTMLRDDLQESVAEHVKTLIPARLHKGVTEVYAVRGTSGARFYHPGQEVEETGLWVNLDKLP